MKLIKKIHLKIEVVSQASVQNISYCQSWLKVSRVEGESVLNF